MTIHIAEIQEFSSGLRELDQLLQAPVDGGLAGRPPALERKFSQRK
jgi:hypothetical protein